MLSFRKIFLPAIILLFGPAYLAFAADVVLIQEGTSRAAIFVSPRVMDDAKKNPEPPAVWRSYRAEDHRRRLRESVRDLAGILERITGARVEIIAGKPGSSEKRIPILIGELAVENFGQPKKKFPLGQGFRLLVSPTGIGLAGESDLGTSYAIYTLLHQLGCRWYMPSPMGEVLPSQKTLAVAEQDISTGPFTTYRGLWYCDNDFARRNRLGGMELAAGHALEFTVPKELRKTRPDIRAMINGKPHDHLVKWTHPLVAESIAQAFLKQLAKDPYIPTFSLSPDDGATWDESDDIRFDARDFDPAAGCISKTDRLMVLANRVAGAIAPKYPRVRFGILAYANYIRPPVREKPHPSLVPQIAPITFSRAHPMDDDGEPNNKDYRKLVEGWAKLCPEVSYYFYAYNLAEVSSPNPMITRWSRDIAFIFNNGHCKYWQPETISNFETSIHAHYLGMRLAWDPGLDPQKIVTELNRNFYGQAAKEMADYWRFIDNTWVKTPEYSGCGFGHLRRWPPRRLTEARELLDLAGKACRTEVEKFRVKMASDSLEHFELFMTMRRGLADGRFADFESQVKRYRDLLIALGEKYQPQYAFARMGWTGPNTLNVRYFDSFYKETYDDAARIAKNFDILTKPPLRNWIYRRDPDKIGEKNRWHESSFDDKAWPATDVARDTWSTLKMHNFMGSLWYRTDLTLAPPPAGKKVYLWIGATDGRVKVFVNGRHVPYVDPKGKQADSFTGYCQPASFNITSFVSEGKNQISLLCTREFLNELGTGGLLAPPVVYREK